MIREEQKKLSEEYRQRAGAEIAMRLVMYPVFQQVETVFCYVSTEQEPDTRMILETAWSMGKTVAVPRCVPGPERRMEAVVIRSFEDLEPGMMGILEPKQGLPVLDGYKVDLAVVPCVSADRSGGRLGHGAGYYDRFLHGQAMYKFGLCFEELLMDNVAKRYTPAAADMGATPPEGQEEEIVDRQIPMESHDVRLDRVITEKQNYNARVGGEDVAEELRDDIRRTGLFQKLRGLFGK